MKKATADAARCLSLLTLALSRGDATPAELAAAADLPEGQVYRDLFGALLLCGTPPYLPHQFVSCVMDGGKVRVRFAEHFRRPVSLTPLEALALASVVEATALPDPEASRALLSKIEASMAEEPRRKWRALRRLLRHRPASESDAATRALLRDAATRRAAVKLRYRSAGALDATVRVVGPLGLFERRGVWYLAALDLARREVRTYRLDRSWSASPTEERFERPAGFKLSSVASRSAALAAEARRADVKIGPASARRVAEIAEPGDWRPAGEGGRWRPSFFGLDAFAATLIALDLADFEVKGPAALREKVADVASRARDAHGPPMKTGGKRRPSKSSAV
jgi:proteasome accessory factor C